VGKNARGGGSDCLRVYQELGENSGDQREKKGQCLPAEGKKKRRREKDFKGKEKVAPSIEALEEG